MTVRDFARVPGYQIRSTNSETNSNYSKANVPNELRKTASNGGIFANIRRCPFSSFGLRILNLFRISNFGFRISPTASAQNHARSFSWPLEHAYGLTRDASPNCGFLSPCPPRSCWTGHRRVCRGLCRVFPPIGSAAARDRCSTAASAHQDRAWQAAVF